MTFGHITGGLNNAHACTGSTGEVCYPNVKDTPLYPDTWYTVEAYVKSSACSTCRNGTVKWWINGALQANYTNLNYGDGIVNQWQINHTWDGSSAVQCGSPTHPANTIGRDCRKEQAQYFDHVILASVGGSGSPSPAPTPVPQPTPVPPPTTSYKTTMRAQHSGKCVDAGVTTADGVSLTQRLATDKTRSCLVLKSWPMEEKNFTHGSTENAWMSAEYRLLMERKFFCGPAGMA